MSQIDANTKVTIGVLFSILGLGAGGIWKMSNLDTRLYGIETAVKDLLGRLDHHVTRAEFDTHAKYLDQRLSQIEKVTAGLGR